jgi:hypothetical protein
MRKSKLYGECRKALFFVDTFKNNEVPRKSAGISAGISAEICGKMDSGYIFTHLRPPAEVGQALQGGEPKE